jgi:hypothetical protein
MAALWLLVCCSTRLFVPGCSSFEIGAGSGYSSRCRRTGSSTGSSQASRRSTAIGSSSSIGSRSRSRCYSGMGMSSSDSDSDRSSAWTFGNRRHGPFFVNVNANSNAHASSVRTSTCTRTRTSTFLLSTAASSSSSSTDGGGETDDDDGTRSSTSSTDVADTTTQDSMNMDNMDTNMDNTNNTDGIDSPVLRMVYPALLQHVAEYGHPNIPLGSTAGRQCEILRRLHTQQKLSAADVARLESIATTSISALSSTALSASTMSTASMPASMSSASAVSSAFRWHSLEDVAQTADFNELLARLVQYSVDHDGDVSPRKKDVTDPELGAWVTGLRRVGPADTDADRVRALNAIGFQWQSPRQCGSAFMMQYRSILERLNMAAAAASSSASSTANSATASSAASAAADSVSAVDSILSEPEVQQWIQAQREAVKRGTLSETRQHYMESVAGVDWLVVT